MIRVLVWGVGGLALIIALAAAALFYLIRTPPPGAVALSGVVTTQALHVGALERSYLLYAPAESVAAAPLLVVFHGSMSSGADMRLATGYQFDRLADESGFVVVYPNGYDGHWNDCRRIADYAARTLNIDDIAFFDALIAQVGRQRHIDPARVFVVGLSNGAHFVFRLALEHPQAIAGAAVFGANLPTAANSDCAAQGEPPPILFVDGDDDPINPYQGGIVTLFGFGNRGEVLSAQASAAHFAQQRRAEGPIITRIAPARTGDPTSVERSAWRRQGVDDVVLLTIHGGGHVVPQPVSHAPRLLGRMTTAINGPEEAWRFFAAHAPRDDVRADPAP